MSVVGEMSESGGEMSEWGREMSEWGWGDE